jgi:hypothetical protein
MPSGPPVAGPVLCLDREFDGLLFAKLVPLPEATEEVKPEVPAYGLFDHLTLALARARRPHLHRPKHGLVDRDGGPRLPHLVILASRRALRRAIPERAPVS